MTHYTNKKGIRVYDQTSAACKTSKVGAGIVLFIVRRDRLCAALGHFGCVRFCQALFFRVFPYMHDSKHWRLWYLSRIICKWVIVAFFLGKHHKRTSFATKTSHRTKMSRRSGMPSDTYITFWSVSVLQKAKYFQFRREINSSTPKMAGDKESVFAHGRHLPLRAEAGLHARQTGGREL